MNLNFRYDRERLFNLGDVRLIMLVHWQRIEILSGIFLNLQKLL